jgi:hypothetical protein
MKKFSLLLTLIIFVLINVCNKKIIAQDFSGSESCKNCHSSIHTSWKLSGHPWKIQKTNGNAPTFPVLTSQKSVGNVVNYTLTSGLPGVPSGLTWGDISFVVGGYHSNARFLDKDGYLIWGDNRQYNLSTQKWVSYTQSAPGKGSYSYSCYKCHTTGPSKTKTPEFQAYPGIEGSWFESGVGCEACHGAAKNHVLNITQKPSKVEICSNCHARDRNEGTTTFPWNTRVEWQARTVNSISTGFIRHREQGDMLMASKHGKAGFNCVTCHDPHKGVYFEQGGLKATASCETCHPNKEIKGHEQSKTKAKCVDCHMPNSARNGDHLSPYVADQSAHYWKIITDPVTMFQNTDDISSTATPPVVYKFIKLNSNGISGNTLDYSCIQCHTTKDVAWASSKAKNIHTIGTSVGIASNIPSAYTLGQNYPNPFNPTTNITFALPKSSKVTLTVYSVDGELVKTLIDKEMNSGWHEVNFDAGNLASGIYIYRIIADQFAFSRKMMLMK